MEIILSTLINGLSLGGIYAMIALGYTMVYGIAKMLNFAHGDIIMVGGYVIYVFMATNNPLLAIAMAVIGCVILGITIAFVLLLGVIYSFSQISESNAELSAMKTKIAEVEAEAAKMSLIIEEKNDIGVIEKNQMLSFVEGL